MKRFNNIKALFFMLVINEIKKIKNDISLAYLVIYNSIFQFIFIIFSVNQIKNFLL